VTSVRFIQIMEYETTRGDEIEAKMQEAMQAGRPGPSLVRLAHTRDHDNPNHYVDIIEFTSYDEAMENSAKPETDQMARELRELCTSGPTYANLDVMMETPN
jgi:hypothetical protein